MKKKEEEEYRGEEEEEEEEEEKGEEQDDEEKEEGVNKEEVESPASKLAPTRFSVTLVGGEPKMRVQMTGSTSYVAHDDSWDSYSISQTVDMNGAPAALASAIDVPAPLLEMFVKEGAYFDHSVFMAPAAKRAELLAAFEAVGGK